MAVGAMLSTTQLTVRGTSSFAVPSRPRTRNVCLPSCTFGNFLLPRPSTLAPQSVDATPSMEQSNPTPVRVENTKVGFLSLETAAGPLTSAVSMMRS